MINIEYVKGDATAPVGNGQKIIVHAVMISGSGARGLC